MLASSLSAPHDGPVRTPSLTAGLAAAVLLTVAGCSGDDASGEESVVVNETPSDSPSSTEPDGSGPSQQPESPPEPQVAETIATGLTSPWGLDFLPDDSALVAERDTGLVKRVTPEGDVRTVGEIEGVDTETTSEGGLLGLAVGPDFGSEPYVYVYYTSGEDNRIARLTYRQGRLGSQRVIFEGIPRGENHNGGRIAFGPDGMLYATTGETYDREFADEPNSLRGKILRLMPDGTVPRDNPDPRSPVWTLGHRNPQGIAWDGDLMWAAEFGQDRWDEINVIEPGSDYGWPECEGRCDDPDVVDPKVQWTTDEASPSGIAYADGAVWMAGLGGERLWRIATDGERVVGEPEAFFTGEYGRLRTIEVAPDGSLWLTTSNTDGRGEVRDGDDRILRLTLE